MALLLSLISCCSNSFSGGVGDDGDARMINPRFGLLLPVYFGDEVLDGGNDGTLLFGIIILSDPGSGRSIGGGSGAWILCGNGGRGGGGSCTIAGGAIVGGALDVADIGADEGVDPNDDEGGGLSGGLWRRS